MTWHAVIEWSAVALGIACVVLTIYQNIWCWPVGLAQVVLFIWVFFQAKLYSDMGLHVIYVGLQVYGWWAWLHGGRKRTALAVSRISARGAGAWCAAAITGTATLGYTMDRFTDAALPYWDAATTVLSLIAQYLMARKILESWLVWITVDVLCVGIYYAKQLYPTMGLYFVFLGLATTGLFAWRMSFQKQQLAPVEA